MNSEINIGQGLKLITHDCDYCGGFKRKETALYFNDRHSAVTITDFDEQNRNVTTEICVRCFKKVFDVVLLRSGR